MTNLSGNKRQPLNKLPVVDKLTPVERRVAELLSQGMTNRQIAEAIGWKAQSIPARIVIVKDKLASMRCDSENSNR